jgi:tetratricopeptide (TPR) repeat protein
VARAEPAIAALLKEHPQTPAVHGVNGSLQLLKRNMPAARTAFERALQLDSNSFAAFAGLVSVDLIEKRVPAAKARIEERLRTDVDKVELLLLAARVYIESNDGVAAERMLRRVIELAPADSTAYMLLANVYVGQGKLELAQAEFDRLALRHPRDIGVRLMSGILAHEQRNLPAARKRYEEVLELDADSAVASNNLAWILAESGADLDRALRLAQRAVDRTPERADFSDTLGWIYIKKQLPALAIPFLERAVAANPDDPTFHYHLGLALAESGESAKARVSLQKAISTGANFTDATAAKKLLSTLN